MYVTTCKYDMGNPFEREIRVIIIRYSRVMRNAVRAGKFAVKS